MDPQIVALIHRIEALERAVFPGTEVAVPKKTPTKRGTRLHDHWSPGEDVVDVMCAELHVTREMLYPEHRKFVDYWIAQPGQKGVKLNWESTWRNWMRRAAEQGSLGMAARTSVVDQKVAGWQELGRAASSE